MSSKGVSPVETESKSKKKYDEWELDSAMRTLQEAEEIKADAAKMKALGPYIKKKKEGITSIEQLRKLSIEKQRES